MSNKNIEYNMKSTCKHISDASHAKNSYLHYEVLYPLYGILIKLFAHIRKWKKHNKVYNRLESNLIHLIIRQQCSQLELAF